MMRSCALVLSAALVAGCWREAWPEPPAVDLAAYQKQHETWREEETQALPQLLSIIGIWPIAEGETAFGSDATLPIALPATHFPSRAGVVRRSGDEITVVPAPGAPLRLPDGTPLRKPAAVEMFAGGPINLIVTSTGDSRRWLLGADESHPAVKNPPVAQSYPLDARWRVAARFDAFDTAKSVRVPDVRGGEMEFMAIGQLVFRLDDQEMKLTAFGEPGSDDLFVMFKDPTNKTTTYQGYRIVSPKTANDGEGPSSISTLR
jgi:uncharacterized protein